MRNEVLIYDRNKESIGFLRNFFHGNDCYSPTFVKDKQSLFNRLTRKTPAALIVGSPAELEKIRHSNTGCPVIAMVSGDINGGIRSAVKCNTECYLISPFHKEDFEYKLKTTISKKAFLKPSTERKKTLKQCLNLIRRISSTLDPKKEYCISL